jgi:hypothetical protein
MGQTGVLLTLQSGSVIIAKLGMASLVAWENSSTFHIQA